MGKKLTAKAGEWGPKGVTLSYQWYAGTKPIKGATKATTLVHATEAGQTITVRVTGRAIQVCSVPGSRPIAPGGPG